LKRRNKLKGKNILLKLSTSGRKIKQKRLNKYKEDKNLSQSNRGRTSKEINI
jgi:hypothetical protein